MAEIVLVLFIHMGYGNSMTSIPMQNMQACEAAKTEFLNKLSGSFTNVAAFCWSTK